MSPQTSPSLPTQSPHTRVGGSIPSRATSSHEEAPAGKPGKTWEVGAPYIIDQHDAPDWKRIVVCTHADGRCRYLCINHNRRWPHVMQLSERSTPLAAFGIVLWQAMGTIEGEQSQPCVATYPDGKPRRWQAGKTNSMPLMAPDPKYWRLDPQVAPKLIKWIERHLPSAQLLKTTENGHDAAWTQHFILPLAEFMQQRRMQSLHLRVTDGKVAFELVPVGEDVVIYELVDATDEEERYYPLGVFLDMGQALKSAEGHDPAKWEPIVDTDAVVEIRARKLGTSGGMYAVLWRGRWDYDYEASSWKLVEQQTGTLEKPLPLTRA